MYDSDPDTTGDDVKSVAVCLTGCITAMLDMCLSDGPSRPLCCPAALWLLPVSQCEALELFNSSFGFILSH